MANPETTFYDSDPPVLINKLGLRDPDKLREAEKLALDDAYYQLTTRELDLQKGLTCALLKEVHAAIFGKLYEWAGRWRMIDILKEDMRWPSSVFLNESMRALEREHLRPFPPSKLCTDHDFCEGMARIHGEFIAVHPFREGNGRTIRLACDLLALNSGRPKLAYDRTEAGKAQYIYANRLAACRQDYTALASVIEVALERARSQTVTTNEPAMTSPSDGRAENADVTKATNEEKKAVQTTDGENQSQKSSQEQRRKRTLEPS